MPTVGLDDSDSHSSAAGNTMGVSHLLLVGVQASIDVGRQAHLREHVLLITLRERLTIITLP
jgi:hypothetical protein